MSLEVSLDASHLEKNSGIEAGFFFFFLHFQEFNSSSTLLEHVLNLHHANLNEYYDVYVNIFC